MPDCNSDEKGCKLLIWKEREGYNKLVPPVSSESNGDVIAVPVKVSMIFYRVANIMEAEHAIELQFEIMLEWNDNRLIYQNLKLESYLNSLSEEDFRQLWLPQVIRPVRVYIHHPRVTC